MWKKKWLLFVLGIVLMLAVLLGLEQVITADGMPLSTRACGSMAILVFCLYLWITEVMPFHMAGMLGIVLTAFLQVDTFGNAVMAGFGNDTVLFFLAVSILSAYVTLVGLGARISSILLAVAGSKAERIILAFLICGAILSMWISAMAAAAILTPIALAVLKRFPDDATNPGFRKALMIACAWGSIIGGMATPVGAGPNQLSIGLIRDMLGIQITFFQWMLYGAPCAALLILPAWWILRMFFRPAVYANGNLAALPKVNAAPKLRRDEIAVLGALALSVLLWSTTQLLEQVLPFDIPMSLPPLLSACLLFLPGVTSIRWEQINREISWSNIILLATGITIGSELYYTGAADWLTNTFLGGFTSLPTAWMVFTLVVGVSIIKIGFSSNTVTATIMMPILISMASSYDGPVLGLLLPPCLTFPLSYILVTSSPTSVIPYATGQFTMADMARAGVVMTVVSAAIITGVMIALGTITGIYL